MFNHMGVDLPTHSLSRIQENGKRFYLTPDGGKYPSITTVLGWFSRKGIMEWRKRVGEAEANKISTQASRSGTNVHQMAEDHLNNIEWKNEKTMPYDMETFLKIKPTLDERVNNIYAQKNHCIQITWDSPARLMSWENLMVNFLSSTLRLHDRV